MNPYMMGQPVSYQQSGGQRFFYGGFGRPFFGGPFFGGPFFGGPFFGGPFIGIGFPFFF